jgi:hypothetical protein
MLSCSNQPSTPACSVRCINNSLGMHMALQAPCAAPLAATYSDLQDSYNRYHALPLIVRCRRQPSKPLRRVQYMKFEVSMRMATRFSCAVPLVATCTDLQYSHNRYHALPHIVSCRRQPSKPVRRVRCIRNCMCTWVQDAAV